jgi:hypothetical protein
MERSFMIDPLNISLRILWFPLQHTSPYLPQLSTYSLHRTVGSNDNVAAFTLGYLKYARDG